jgi:predicted Zn finger-like uncharacterized protein
MIVVCPTCFSKYSVQTDVIGREKLVRCAMCGTTWRQSSFDDSSDKRRPVFNLMKWIFFWSVVFLTVFTLFFAKNAVIKIWPAVSDFYELVGIRSDSEKSLIIRDMSNFFTEKNDVLYMGLKGELINVSDEVQILPCITISLRDDENVKKDFRYRKIWTHNFTYKKLLPNQKVVFETELQSIPRNNLICDIKLDAL